MEPTVTTILVTLGAMPHLTLYINTSFRLHSFVAFVLFALMNYKWSDRSFMGEATIRKIPLIVFWEDGRYVTDPGGLAGIYCYDI